MRQPGSSVAGVLGVVLMLGLAAQLAWTWRWAAEQPTWVLGSAFTAAALLLSWGLLALRSALAPLWHEAMRLQELAIGWGGKRSLAPGVHHADEPALAELSALRTRLRGLLTEESRAAEREAHARAHKAGFLRAVRHELRTPLNAILGFSDVLLSDADGPLTTGQRENLEVVRRTARRLSELFDDVLELAAEVGKEHPTEVEPIELRPLLDDLAEALEQHRGPNPVHIQVAGHGPLDAALGDAARLRRLLLSMARHALSVVRGELLVLDAVSERVAPGEPSRVRIEIRDPARVLNSEELATLLGPGPSSARRKGLDESTRLRLALFHELAELAGGRFTFSSDAGGACLALSLPSVPEPGRIASPVLTASP